MAGSKKATAVVEKKKCPLTKEQFLEVAEAIPIEIGGQRMTAEVKVFKTGSYGFYVNGKVVVMVGDTPVACQVGLNLTAIGSKPEE